MKQEKMDDKRIMQAMIEMTDDVYADAAMKEKIDRKIDFAGGLGKGEKMTKRSHILKFAIAAAAICVIAPATVFAAGKVASYCTSVSIPNEDTHYEHLEQMQKKVGYQFYVPEQFSNGYSFASMNYDDVAKLDENGNKIGSFREWCGTYTRENCPDANITISQIQADDTESACEPLDIRQIGEISVSYHVDHYKFVPQDYVLTPEDKEKQAGPHFYISYGADQVEEKDYTDLGWQDNGLDYSISLFDTDLSEDELYQMAEEMIEKP